MGETRQLFTQRFIKKKLMIIFLTSQVSDLLAAGKVKATISQVIPMEALAEAHACMEGMHVRGKKVVKIAES